MEWLGIVSMILGLMGQAQKIYEGISGKGSVKKEAVTAFAQTVVSDMATVSTGGQKDTWTNIAPAVSTLIDAAATIANSTSNLLGKGPIVDMGAQEQANPTTGA